MPATIFAGSGTFQPSLILRRARGQTRRIAEPCPLSRRRRLSSAVEQRFCKPKVGGSIPSAGTSDLADIAALPIGAPFVSNQRCQPSTGLDCVRLPGLPRHNNDAVDQLAESSANLMVHLVPAPRDLLQVGFKSLKCSGVPAAAKQAFGPIAISLKPQREWISGR
jgi:hypothetical protein